jgi:homoserine acetyltransferase
VAGWGAERVVVPPCAVPALDMRALVARLPAGRLHEISSLFGHDAFLKESDQLRDIFATALGSAS